MNKKLSPEMKAALDYGVQNGGVLLRHPGGFWANAAWEQNKRGRHFGTNTIHALVTRGYAEYSEWRVNSRGEFPVAIKVKPQNQFELKKLEVNGKKVDLNNEEA